MEIKDALDRFKIIGYVGSYNSSLDNSLVSSLNIKNIDNALKMVGLDKGIKDKMVSELSLSEQLKVDLATKLDKDVIVIGNLSRNLINKDIEYIKKLLVKLSSEYNKKVVVIDEDINVFINLVKYIYVIKNKEVIYETNDFFESKLYEYIKMPKVVEFIKFVNKNEKRLDNNLDIYEIIKDVYRRVS